MQMMIAKSVARVNWPVCPVRLHLQCRHICLAVGVVYSGILTYLNLPARSSRSQQGLAGRAPLCQRAVSSNRSRRVNICLTLNVACVLSSPKERGISYFRCRYKSIPWPAPIVGHKAWRMTWCVHDRTTRFSDFQYSTLIYANLHRPRCFGVSR